MNKTITISPIQKKIMWIKQNTAWLSQIRHHFLFLFILMLKIGKNAELPPFLQHKIEGGISSHLKTFLSVRLTRKLYG